jgi:hypothetical protein
MKLSEPRAHVAGRRGSNGRSARANRQSHSDTAIRAGHPDCDTLIQLQRQAGNRAVLGWLTVQRGPPDSADDTVPSTDPNQPPVWVEEVRDALRAEGVKESELGASSAIEALGETQARALLEKLHAYRTDKELGFTSSSKIARSWSNRRDDLGVMGRSGYPTILHYVQDLDKLTRASLGGEWPSALKTLKGSTIRLAGGTYFVHPRMLYFAAAAQIGMDAKADRDEADGHYITPAAVFEELRLIRKAALAVDELGAEVEKSAAKIGVIPVGPEGAAAVYENLVQRLQDVVALRRKQEAAEESRSYGTGHPEPGISKYVTDEMVAAIEELPSTATSDTDGVQNCRKIMVMVWHRPRKKQAHGWGAADPHGSHHAMGMAMDVFYGTGAGGYSNFAKFLKGEGVAEAVAFLVQQFGTGAEYGFSDPAASPKDLLTAIKRNAHDSVAFALLLRDHGTDALALLDEGVKEAGTPEAKEAIARYKALHRKLVGGVRARQARVVTLTRHRAWLRHQPELRAYAKDVARRATSGELVRHEFPPAFLESARTISGEYEALRVSIELTDGSAAVNLKIGPSAAPELASPLEELGSSLPEITRALEAKRRSDIRRHVPSGLKKAIDRAGSGTLVLDQPQEVLSGLGSVKGASLQSWHHFQLRDWRGVLTSPEVYKNTLLSDMWTRSLEDMRRILQVMSQSPAGFRAVFGDEEGKPGLASIRPALDSWAQVLSTLGVLVDIDGMLEEVAEQLPPPAMEGLSSTRKSLASDLYARGFYDVALVVAGNSAGGA